MIQKFSIIFVLALGSMVLLSLNQVYGQENEVIVTMTLGSADAGSGENNDDNDICLGDIGTRCGQEWNTTQQTETETRTFQDCFSEGMSALTIFLVFASTENLSVADLIDPAYKKLIINMCNFYHEKTGTWISVMGDRDISAQYGQEFYNKYSDTIPEKVKQFVNNQSSIIK